MSRAYAQCALMLIMLAGCASPPTAEEVGRVEAYMMRWEDVRERRPTGHRMAFTRNDLPTPVMKNLGWKERQVMVELVRQDSGTAVFQSTLSLPRNELKYIYPRNPLPAGAYHLRVTPENSPPVVQNFSVYGY